MTKEELCNFKKPIYKEGQFIVIVGKSNYDVYCQINDLDDYEFVKNFKIRDFVNKHTRKPILRLLGAQRLLSQLNKGELTL